VRGGETSINIINIPVIEEVFVVTEEVKAFGIS